jgi:Excalibur calcium-binding domain
MVRVLIAAAFVCLAAAIGAAPAAGADAPYPNCKAAAADDRYDIPSDDPAYDPWLDRDQDGIGCET